MKLTIVNLPFYYREYYRYENSLSIIKFKLINNILNVIVKWEYNRGGVTTKNTITYVLSEEQTLTTILNGYKTLTDKLNKINKYEYTIN